MRYTGKSLWRSAATFACCTCAAGSALISCQRDGERAASFQTNVVVDLTGLTRSAADNTQVYVFDNSGANNFHHKVLQITRPEENTLMMPMPEGTWDLALVATPDGSGMNSVLSPVVGLPRSGQKMLELIPTGDLLPPAPELAMGSLDDQTIAPHIDNTAPPVSLVRNVALVRLTIQSPRNYSMIPGAQKVTLGNIPTTLDWNGKLLPDKNSPRTGGTARMEGFFDIIELADSGDQECSRVEFVIPANREDSSADISTHKIDVQVSLDIAGQPYISTIKEIDKAPRANMILDVTLVIGAELTMEADILPWDDTTPVQGIDIDPVPQTTLRVNKTQMMLSQATDWRDDLLTVVATSNGDYVHPSVEHGELWLTSNWIGNVLHLGIDRENYPWNPPATTFITLNVDNGFKKRINVSKPEITTPATAISVSPPEVIMWPGNETATVTVGNFTTSSNPAWRISSGLLPFNATVTPLTGMPGAQIDFQSRVHTTEEEIPEVYGTYEMPIHNIATLQTQKITVTNLYMRADEGYIRVPNDNVTGETSRAIEIFGGSRSFTVVAGSMPAWITNATCISNPDPATQDARPYILSFDVTASPDGEGREGTITIANADAPSYMVALTVKQPVRPAHPTPKFLSVIVNHTYTTTNVSGAVSQIEFSNTAPTGIPFFSYGTSGKVMGMLLSSRLTLNGETWPYNNSTIDANTRTSDTWAQDATTLAFWGNSGAGNSHSTVIKLSLLTPASSLDDDTGLPRVITIDAWGTWYASSGILPYTTSPIRMTIQTFEGGTMIKPSVGSATHPLYSTTMYNVPTGTTSAQLTSEGYSIVNPPSPNGTGTKVYDARTFVQSTTQAANFRTGRHGSSGGNRYYSTKMATITYDRYSHVVTITWNTKDQAGTTLTEYSTQGTLMPPAF